MPHYKDGTEAKLGDVIKGTPYNTPHEVIGVVTGITPNSEACNLRVAFARPATVRHHARMIAVMDTWGVPPVLVDLDTDYGETRAFELVHRHPEEDLAQTGCPAQATA